MSHTIGPHGNPPCGSFLWSEDFKALRMRPWPQKSILMPNTSPSKGKTACLQAVSAYFLLLPRRPSMLRFKSAIFPSEEVRNCFSLSSKA